MTVKTTTAFLATMSTARLTALQALSDANAPLKFVFYSGTVPTTANDALNNNTEIVIMPLKTSNNKVGTSSNGAITFSFNSPSFTVDNTGVISFGRLIDSTTPSVVILQGTAGTSNADFIFTTTSVTFGDSLSPSSFVLTEN